ncbi:MAG TPA: hypothetical protein VLF91_03755 [Candidatus Saccharimonadales bacterium]|nr:hypothetical protein [Candidatus Saccharimonadales bacterium]
MSELDPLDLEAQVVPFVAPEPAAAVDLSPAQQFARMVFGEDARLDGNEQLARRLVARVIEIDRSIGRQGKPHAKQEAARIGRLLLEDYALRDHAIDDLAKEYHVDGDTIHGLMAAVAYRMHHAALPLRGSSFERYTPRTILDDFFAEQALRGQASRPTITSPAAAVAPPPPAPPPEQPAPQTHEARRPERAEELIIASVSPHWTTASRKASSYQELTISDNDTLILPDGDFVLLDDEITLVNELLKFPRGAWTSGEEIMERLYSEGTVREFRLMYRATHGRMDTLMANDRAGALLTKGILERQIPSGFDQVKRKLRGEKEFWPEWRLNPSLLLRDQRQELAEQEAMRTYGSPEEAILEAHRLLSEQGWAYLPIAALGLGANLHAGLTRIFDSEDVRRVAGDVPATRERGRDAHLVRYFRERGPLAGSGLEAMIPVADGYIHLRELADLSVQRQVNSNIGKDRPPYPHVHTFEHTEVARLLATFAALAPPNMRQHIGELGANYFRTYDTVVERPHSDGEDLVGIYVHSKTGHGARTRLYGDWNPRNGLFSRPRVSKEIKPGWLLVFRDLNLHRHDVTPLIRDEHGHTKREAVIMTLSFRSLVSTRT